MRVSRFGQSIRFILPHFIPIAAVALWTRVSFEAGYNAGWAAFQNPHAVLANGRPMDWMVGNVLAAASIILVSNGKTKVGNALASVLCLLAGTVWLEMTA